jgi:hypothetical protein
MPHSRLWILDRIEDEETAVLIDEGGEGERLVPAADLPSDVKEGDALRQAEGSKEARWTLDREATERLRAEARDLRSSLRRGPPGALSL